MKYVLVLASIVLFSACDGGGPERALIGDWNLVEVTGPQAVPVNGPSDASLSFRSNGTFAIRSINGCNGQFFAVEEEVWFAEAVCTLIGGSREGDLTQLLFLGGSTPRYQIEASGDLVFSVYSDDPSTLPFYALRFERAD